MRHYKLLAILFTAFYLVGLNGCCSCMWEGFSRASQTRQQNTFDLDIEKEFVSANPAAGDSTVPINTKFSVIFKDQGARMIGNLGTVFILRDQYNKEVKGKLFYNKGVVTFSPDANLQPGWNYRITIGGLGYEKGKKINGYKSWVITTIK